MACGIGLDRLFREVIHGGCDWQAGADDVNDSLREERID
jgi:hypothetical protein